MSGLVELLEWKMRGDARGWLMPVEGDRDVPFEIRRVYLIGGTNRGIVRGAHAHRVTSQVAACINGSCTMILEDEHRRESVRLDAQNKALVIPPMVWHEMRDFSPECLLLVLADTLYDESDYIRDYGLFRQLAEHDRDTR